MKKTSIGVIALIMIITACAGTPSATSPARAATPVNAEFAAFENAIEKAFAMLQPRLSAGKRIALLPVNAEDKDSGGYAYDTMTVKFINADKYEMVERARIDQILREQNFQMSGMVSDETAVSIGKFLGANVIIIGDISGTAGSTRRLVFRALDVETAKILGVASERY